MLFKRCIFGIGIVISILTSSLAMAGTGLTYHGRILKPDGSALEAPMVQFTIQIRSPGNESCLLYQETQSVDMSDSGGAFSLEVGSNPGFRVSAAIDGGYSLSKIFANHGTLTLPTCNFGSTYAPNTADGRLLYISFNDGSGTQTLSPQKITYVPYAVEAMQLNGYTASQILRVDSGVAPVLSAANLAALNDLFNGTLTPNPGTVTNVTSLNSYLSITNNTTTPQLTVNVGTAAGTVAAGNDPRFIDSRTPTGSAGGDLGGNYPNPSLAKINGVSLAIASLSSSQYLKYDGSNWANSSILIADVTGLSTQLGNKIDATQLPANCAANQTLNFLAPTGTWTCANIALDAAAITSGTIAGARLPASATYWQDAGSGNIYYNAGSVGIGTTNPTAKLEVNGALKIGTSTPIGRFTLCAKSSTTATTVVGENLYNWNTGDCNNGYPNNTCIGTISKSVVPGVEHNLAALGPSEKSHPSGTLTSGANGGFGFFTDTASAGNGVLDIRVVYMCQN